MRSRRLLITILCFSLAVPVTAGDKLIWASMLTITGGLDLASTRAAETRGAKEAAPLVLLVGESGRIPLKMVGVVGVVIGAELLKRKGHDKWAWVFVSGAAMIWAGAAIHNHRTERGGNALR